MPLTEYSDKVIRYREHRINLTRFANSSNLLPRYAMFAELILLWLDSREETETKLWSCLAFYMGMRRKAGTGEFETGLPEESQMDKEAKEKLKTYLNDFLSESDE